MFDNLPQEVLDSTTEPYMLNPLIADLLDPWEAEELQRTLGVWRNIGWRSRDEITTIFDKGADFSAIEDIGPIRTPHMENLLNLPDDLFETVTGLPVSLEQRGALPPEVFPIHEPS